MPCEHFANEMVEFMRLYRGLPDRERVIIGARFGFDGSTGLSLNQLGKVFEVSNERIRQIEKVTLTRMYAQMEH